MTIYDEIRAERDHQIERFGVEADLEVNTPNDFVAYIGHHATRWFTGGFVPYPPAQVDIYRKQMIKVAALAVAAVQALDIQRDNNGAAFFEEQIL